MLYASYRYHWGLREVGLLLAAVGICSAIVQGGLIRPIVARFGPRITLIAGYLLGAAGMTIYGLASTPLAFCCGIPFGALWGLAGPSAQQLMTQRVGGDAQGKLQGAGGSIMAIGNLIGPILFTQIFAATAPWGLGYSGLAFVVAGALLVLAALCAAFTLRQTATQPQ